MRCQEDDRENIELAEKCKNLSYEEREKILKEFESDFNSEN